MLFCYYFCLITTLLTQKIITKNSLCPTSALKTPSSMLCACLCNLCPNKVFPEKYKQNVKKKKKNVIWPDNEALPGPIKN